MPKIDALMGKMFEVEITECNKFSMKGKIVDETVLLSKRAFEVKMGQVTGLKASVNIFGRYLKKIFIYIKLKLYNFKKTNSNKNSCVDNESTCCGGSCSNETPSKKSCCDSEINDKKTNIMEKTVLQYSNREKLRDYAYASLYAISAILLSKVALRFLYSK